MKSGKIQHLAISKVKLENEANKKLDNKLINGDSVLHQVLR